MSYYEFPVPEPTPKYSPFEVQGALAPQQNLASLYVPKNLPMGQTPTPQAPAPVAPTAPNTVPGFMGSVNPIMARLGQALMSPQGKKALAMGMNTANIVGRTKNWAGPLGQYMSGIMGQGAVAQQTGGTAPPADNRSMMEQMRAPVTQAAQAAQVKPLNDQNQNNIPDNLEAKINISGNPTRVQKTLSNLLGGSSNQAPAFSVDQGLVRPNFQGDLGANVGTSESTNVPTSVRNSNVGYDDQTALEVLAATLGPDTAVKLATERAGRIAPEMQARAQSLEADIKNRMYEPTLAKTRAETIRAMADAEKTTYDMSPQAIIDATNKAGMVKKAEKEAEAEVARKVLDDHIKNMTNVPIYEPTLNNMGIHTQRQLWEYFKEKAPEVASEAIRATSSQRSAGIRGGAEVAASQKTALAVLVNSTTTRLSQLNKAVKAPAKTDPMYSIFKTYVSNGSILELTPELEAERNRLTNTLNVAQTALGFKGGIDVGGGNHPLAGKPSGRYNVNGKIVKWDGEKEVR